MEQTVETLILGQLNTISVDLKKVTEAVASLQGGLQDFGVVRSTLDRTAQDTAVNATKISNLEDRVNRNERLTQWAVSLAVTSSIALAGVVIALLTFYMKNSGGK
jgi:hypothetical protein